jgi:hypothetical protein
VDGGHQQWLETLCSASERAIEDLGRIDSPYHRALVADLEALASRVRTELEQARQRPTAREERIAQNEILFRQVNDRIEELERGWELREVDFVCECGDASCTAPATITLAAYEAIRQNPRRFIVLPGHEIPDVEKVVERRDRYLVVEKHQERHEQIAAADPR